MRSDWPDWVAGLPSVFFRAFLGIAAWQWLGLALLLGLFWISALVGRAAAIRLLGLRRRLMSRSLTAATEKSIRRAVGLIAGTAVCYLALGELALPHASDSTLRTLLSALAIFGAAMLAYALWDAVCDDIAARAAGSDRAERLLVPMARKFVGAMIVCIALLFAATTLFNADVRGILASLGIGGLVVALAAKDSVENLFGSLTILFDMPFAIGDWVKIDKTEGIVEEINLRSTRIRTFEDTVITVPNANLIRASVENVSARRYRRQQITIRISYDTRPEAVEAFCRDIHAWLLLQPGIPADQAIVRVSDMAESSLGVLIQCHFAVKTQGEELRMRHALAKEILAARDRNGVLFAAHPRPLPPK